MSNTYNKSAGREPTCDLVLDHPGISRVHAHLDLADDGLVSVSDNDSSNGTFLKRSDRWIRIKRVTLCIGDRIRFGELEIPLQQLTSVFGQHSNASLEARHFSRENGHKADRSYSDLAAPVMNKPVRNALTGKIEEQE